MPHDIPPHLAGMTPNSSDTRTSVTVGKTGASAIPRDTVLILGGALLVALIAVPLLLSWTGGTRQPAGSASVIRPEPARAASPQERAMSADQIAAAMARARQLDAQGRFDDALIALEDVPATQAKASGVTDLQAEIEGRRDKVAALALTALDAHTAGKWAAALKSLAAAEQIAPLSRELMDVRTDAKNQLAAANGLARARRLQRAGKIGEALALTQSIVRTYGTTAARAYLDELLDLSADRSERRARRKARMRAAAAERARQNQLRAAARRRTATSEAGGGGATLNAPASADAGDGRDAMGGGGEYATIPANEDLSSFGLGTAGGSQTTNGGGQPASTGGAVSGGGGSTAGGGGTGTGGYPTSPIRDQWGASVI